MLFIPDHRNPHYFKSFIFPDKWKVFAWVIAFRSISVLAKCWVNRCQLHSKEGKDLTRRKELALGLPKVVCSILDEVSAIFFIAASLLQSRNQCHQSDGA
jgi:hypothetical protein